MAIAKDTGGSLRNSGFLASGLRKTTTPLSYPIGNVQNVTAAKSSPAPAPSTGTAPPVVADTYSAYGGDTGGAPAVVPAAPSQEEFLSSDLSFAAQKKALADALAATIADLDAQKQRYNVDYDTSLRKLGFSGNSSILDTAKWDPTDSRWETGDNVPVGGVDWNQTDTNTASGRAFTNALNDYASRGMLQSSAYARALNNLSRSLNEQLSSTATARSNAIADFDRTAATKKQETENSKTAASNEAIARWKAQYGITG